jgi:hypothetical protein
VRLFLNQPIAILKEEVRSITLSRWGRYVIAHTSPDIISPIMLNFVQSSVLAATLDQLARDSPQSAHHGLPKSGYS